MMVLTKSRVISSMMMLVVMMVRGFMRMSKSDQQVIQD
jgi:hypothetical protein